jgi:hypothetical protein
MEGVLRRVRRIEESRHVLVVVPFVVMVMASEGIVVVVVVGRELPRFVEGRVGT